MIVPGADNPFFKIMRGLFYAWILLLVLALYPYTEDPATPIKLLVSALAAVLITGVWTLGMITRRVPWRPVGASLYLLVAFLVVQCGAALFSDAPARSIHAVLPWLIFGVLAFYGQLLFTHTRHLRNLFRVIVGSVALSSIYGLLQYSGLDPFPWALRAVEEYRGLPATYGNPNFAGHALVIALVLCGGLVVEAWRRKKRRYELAACLAVGALLFAHLYLTHMRGGAVALALGVLAVFVAALVHRRIKNTLWAWALGVVASGTILICGALTVVFFAPHLKLESSLQLRLHGYAGASALFLDHWIAGTGPGNYAFHNIPYWSDFEALWYTLEGKRNHHVHNEWLEIAVESGVGGLFLFLLLFLQGLFAPFRYAMANTQKVENTPLLGGVGGGLILARTLKPTPGPSKEGSRIALASSTTTCRKPLHATKSPILRHTILVALFVVAIDACFGFNLHVPVSAAFVFLLLTLKADDIEQRSLPDKTARWGALLLLPLAVTLAFQCVWQFQGECRYQQAQGALAWSRAENTEADARPFRDSARTLFQKAQAYQPWDFRAPMALGNIALIEARPEEALRAFTQALVLHPHLPRLQLGLARAWLQSAQYEKGNGRREALDAAEELASAVVERCPELGEGYAVLGWTHWFREGLVDDAEAGTERRAAVEAFESARLHGVANNPDLEYALWSTWVRTLPEDMAKTLFLARVAAFEKAGVVPPVIRASAAVLRMPPDDTTALKRLADRIARPPSQTIFETNRRYFRPLVQLILPSDSATGVLAFQLGRVCFYAGDYERAETLFRAASKSLPVAELGEVNYYRSRTLAHRGQSASALALAREALQRDRASILYQWNFALRLAEAGEGEAARFQLEALLPQVTNSPAYYEAILATHDALLTPPSTVGAMP